MLRATRTACGAPHLFAARFVDLFGVLIAHVFALSCNCVDYYYQRLRVRFAGEHEHASVGPEHGPAWRLERIEIE